MWTCLRCRLEWATRQTLPESQVTGKPTTEADRLKGYLPVPEWDKLAAKMPPAAR
jgi:hypothetical protein